MMGEVTRGIISEEEKAIDKARVMLRGLGCYECVTYSFGSYSDIEKLGVEKLRHAVKIINPLGDDQAYMRTSPVPDMLKVVANNINKKAADIRLFESGRVYLPSDDEKELPEERKYICIALCGDEDFFSLKGVLENLFDAFGIKNLRYMSEAADYYHPGRKASVYAEGSKLGEFGEIYPDVAEAFDISRRVYVAEIGLKALCKAADDVKKYEPLPKYPAVERDIALIVNADVTSGSLLECIHENAGELFENASLFDVYTGEKLGEGKKSLAYNIVFRAKDRTLMDEEVNAARDAIVEAAGREFGAKLREA
jgi:phenylalanyl-tRNA synthetase beta chain